MLKIQSGTRLRVYLAALFFCLASAGAAQPAIDFSYAGYGGGGVSAPIAPAVISVRPTGADDTELLQGALDHVAALAPQADGRMIGFPQCRGFRGDALAHAIDRVFEPQRQSHELAGGNLDVTFRVGDARPVERALDTA